MPEPEARTAVRIAVVDSGVQPEHPHIDGARVDGGISVSGDGSVASDPDEARDRLGHGTAVAAAIQQWAPDARIVPVRVFRTALATSSTALVSAIDWCADQRIDLINLSLGTTVDAHRPALQRAVARALEGGTIVIAAAEANGAACFPGALAETIGVGTGEACPRERWSVGKTADHGSVFLASGAPRPIPGVPQQRNLWGVSFAVANLTGFAAAILRQERPGPGGPERLAWLRARLAEGAMMPA